MACLRNKSWKLRLIRNAFIFAMCEIRYINFVCFIEHLLSHKDTSISVITFVYYCVLNANELMLQEIVIDLKLVYEEC